MGNACCCISSNYSNRTARIMDWAGNLRSIDIPATAADLMLDSPGHLVSLGEDVLRTGRFQGMKAEEELWSRGVYVLVPIDRVGSKATDRQMEMIETVVIYGTGCMRQKKTDKVQRSGRVFPAVVGDEKENGAGKGKCKGGEVVFVVGFVEGMVIGFPGCRIGTNRCRQWKPVLYTIQESF